MHKNYKLKFSLFLVSFYLLNLNLFASEGTIKGKIIDENGEPLFAANIGIKGTSYGTSTDFDGLFELNVPEGKYDLSLSFIGFNTLEIKDVLVQKESIQSLNDIILTSNTVSLNTVTISATVQRNTESALMVVKKKSPILMDGISSQSFKKSADGNAASAAKRVSGVSVIGGKYVFIRGLGDRYTKTQLNSIDVPGLDPDRNTVQMDIFPTNLIDNIIILKSFTPNLAGDFTGGWVDIQTKDFQSKEVFNFSLGIGYNPAMNFNSNYLSHESTSGDILAFGRSSRELPFSKPKVIPKSEYTQSGGGAQRAESNANAFNKNMDVLTQSSLLNTSFSLDYGNQFNKKNKTYGFNVASGYSNTFSYFDNVIFETYLKNADKTVNELTLAEKNNGS